ncbi:MAG: exosortase-associated EpsI family protein [Verrucomicrobiota bacterium]
MPPFKEAESALDTSIPEKLGPAFTKSKAPTPKELMILAKDTHFSKADCIIPRIEETSLITGDPSAYDLLDVSIILSGHDLANSIHRPERCLSAQGHKIQTSAPSELELGNGFKLPVNTMVTKLEYTTDSGEYGSVDSLTYYFFVGNETITNSHTERTLIDIKDRILKGEAQRWAYVICSMRFHDQPSHPYGFPLPSKEMADKKIREVLTELAEGNIDWERFSKRS